MSPHASSQKNQPWKPSDATDIIRELARNRDMTLDLTDHSRTQMRERDLIVSDVLHVLKHGFVYENPDPASQKNCFKYRVESTSPVGSRVVRIIAIPWVKPPEIKIVTVMWRDE